jgi:hypothetical protein
VKESSIPISNSVIVRKKEKTSRNKPEEGSVMSNVWMLAHKALKTVFSIEDQATKSLEKYKKDFQQWLTHTTLMVLSLFLSLAFLSLGLCYIAIDVGHISRGVVFVCGGLLGFLILRLLTPVTK